LRGGRNEPSIRWDTYITWQIRRLDLCPAVMRALDAITVANLLDTQDTLVPHLLRTTLQYRILATTYDILYNDSKAALLSSTKYTVFPFGKMQQYYFSLFFSGTCAENREYRPEVSGV